MAGHLLGVLEPSVVFQINRDAGCSPGVTSDRREKTGRLGPYSHGRSLLPVNEKLAPNEVNLAMKLIEGMTVEFDPAKYHDTYSEDVKKLLDAKAKGQKRQAPPPQPARSNVIDIVAALQESLAQKKPRENAVLPDAD